MAIYIDIKLIDQDETTKYYSFTDCEGNEYGVLAIDTSNGGIELIRTTNQERIMFSYPRAKRAVQKRFNNGELPDHLYYTS